jgi:eukaryotic-like serine/threonine-protein kinase
MATPVTLSILNGTLASTTKTYETDTTLTIGRDHDCDIQFPPDEIASGISGHHCKVIITAGQVTVQDLGSSNGTFLKSGNRFILLGKRGQPPAVHSLASGAIVKIGEVEIIITIATPPAVQQPPSNPQSPSAGQQPANNPQPSSAAGQQPSNSPQQPPAAGQPPKRPPIAQTALRGGSRIGPVKLKVWDDAKKMLRELSENEVIDQVVPWIRLFNQEGANLPQGIRKHRIQGSLGQGKYGEVFLAYNDKDQIVALKKMFERDMHNPKIVERFDREIKNIEHLKHPNIVRRLGQGIYQNNNFYTMEYCELGDLNRLMEYMGQWLPVDIAKILILQVLDGLTYIHEEVEIWVETKDGSEKAHSLVHRDLKPNNILLRNNGINLQAKIGDFGLSKALGIDPSVAINITTDGNEKLGTYEFMCRKQLLNPRDAGPEVDIWAAAACLYYMLTGYPPRDFSKGRPENVLFQDPVPILDRNPYINPELAQVINIALKEDPTTHAFKYQTATALKQALLPVFP